MNKLITIFTPTFNRASTICRVYESLCKQTYKNFEWIIIDDGSTDNTKDIIEEYIRISNFKILYHYQSNSGKHVALNRAVNLANGSLFIIADSDDAFIPESLEVLISEWENIDNKDKFKGISCKCIDPTTGKSIGNDFETDRYDSNDIDIVLKSNCSFEMWGIIRTDILKKYPFPEPIGLKFYPEAVVWQKIARDYSTRYINRGLRYYFRDQENATTNSKTLRYKENIFLWTHYINNIFDYALYNPKLFIKAFIGLWRDGYLCGKKFKEILISINTHSKRIISLAFFPIGYLFYIKERKYL